MNIQDCQRNTQLPEKIIGVDGNDHSDAIAPVLDMEERLIALGIKADDLDQQRTELRKNYQALIKNLTPVQEHTLQGQRMLRGRFPKLQAW